MPTVVPSCSPVFSKSRLQAVFVAFFIFEIQRVFGGQIAFHGRERSGIKQQVQSLTDLKVKVVIAVRANLMGLFQAVALHDLRTIGTLAPKPAGGIARCLLETL